MTKKSSVCHLIGVMLFIYVACICIGACTPKLDFGNIDFEPQIVVEGWIENNGRANVLLTQWLPLYSEGEEVPAMDIPIKWAKVTLSDGEREEILVGRVDKDYLTSFVYTSSIIKGEYGKTYYLKVEYSGKTLTAETYIPEPVKIENVTVENCEDSLYRITATFKDNPNQKNYYKFFTKVESSNKRFLPSFMSTITDKGSNDSLISLEVNRGMKITEKSGAKYTPYFHLEDTVVIKLTQISETTFKFWTDYESEIMNGKNPLFPSTTNLKSNIKGGKGIWAGYSRDEKIVIIRENVQ